MKQTLIPGLVAGATALVFALPLAFTGCAKLPRNADTGDAAFKAVADDYIAGYLNWRPQAGTALGFHEYDGRITDLSRASVNAELARLKACDSRLERFDLAGFTPRASRDFHILKNSIRREMLNFEELNAYTLNPMTYAAPDLSIYIKRDFAPLESRTRSIISILNQVPALMAAGRANLAESLPRPQTETAIEQANGAADFFEKDLVTALKSVKSAALMSEFAAANQRAIKDLRAFATWLKEEKLPKANEHYAIGRENYVKMLSYGEMLSQSPEQLLEVGMRELKQKQQAFAETARVIDPSMEPVKVFQAIQKDHPTEQSLIPDTARNLESIRQFVLDHHLLTLPSNVRAQVKETPQFARATSFASMDTPGPFEKKATEAFYYVTPVEPEWTPQQKEEWLSAFNYYTTDIVSTHEAYPGHYVQFLCLNASPANRLEKVFSSYAFVEGWAHYAEQMMVDEGFGSVASASLTHEQVVRAAKYKLAQTDEALLRVCRLCVSIRMHCQGMSVDEGTKFFQDNCYYEEKTARQEAIRGAYDPEYLYYTVGKLGLFKLREEFRTQEGPKFSLRKFHDEVLSHGAPPVRLLREILLKDPAQWPEVL